jgi:hypothetical protein
MSRPPTPRTAIPIITTEFHASSPSYTVQRLRDGSVQYRLEERRRTIYLTSNAPHLQLSTQTVDELMKLTKLPESGSDQPRRTRSLQLCTSAVQSGLAPPSPSRSYRSAGASGRRSPVSPKSVSARSSPPSTPASSLQQFWTPISPPRILFYHKHDPHYGFTNFSPHPVMYKGKRYPTSEHLFQSFKVRYWSLVHVSSPNSWLSFRVIDRVSLNIFEHALNGQAWLSPKLVVSSPKCDVTGKM